MNIMTWYVPAVRHLRVTCPRVVCMLRAAAALVLYNKYMYIRCNMLLVYWFSVL